jgi:Nucleotidyltransferase domain
LVRDVVIFIILYYDIFQYPLKEEDIAALLTHKYTPNLIQRTIRDLHEQGVIREYGSYYSTNKNIATLVDQRIKSNEYADTLLKKVPFYAGLLSTIPFVKGIALSGSLSKGSANKNADIDFIVITKHNRLWICKSMVQLLKRTLRLFGKEHFLCANYFIAESKTNIDERNVFIAIELATVIPIYKPSQVNDLLETNKWSQQFVSNHRSGDHSKKFRARHFYLLKLFKYLASFFLFFCGNFLDNRLMNYSRKRWRKAHRDKFKDEADFDSSIKIRKNEVKYHLNSFQHNVNVKFEQQLKDFNTETGHVFSAESLELLNFINQRK